MEESGNREAEPRVFLVLGWADEEMPMAEHDPKEPQPDLHTGMLGDGTEEQNLNQRGQPEARINQDEVQDAFGQKQKQPPQK